MAKLAGLHVICVTDIAKHGIRISSLSSTDKQRPDVYVDSHDTDRAVEIIRTITSGSLRFAIDIRGRDTATLLLRALRQEDSDGERVGDKERQHSHIIGLTGLPKGDPPQGTRYHTVPIKLFHEVQQVGETLMQWLEILLSKGELVAPDVVGVQEGFEGVNAGLEKMRRGEVSWGRLVVRIR